MTDEQKLRLLQVFADAWNKHDIATLKACMTEDCVFEAPAGPPSPTAVAQRPPLHSWRSWCFRMDVYRKYRHHFGHLADEWNRALRWRMF